MDDREQRLKEDHEERLKEVPLRPVNPSTWDKRIRGITVEEVNALGVDANDRLYWHGKEIEFRRRLDLTWWQNLVALVVAVATVIAAIGAVAEGFAVYNDWACKVGWTAAACPPPSPAQAAPPPSPAK